MLRSCSIALMYIVLLLSPIHIACADINPQVALDAKKMVVSINRRSSHAAYEYLGLTYGSGFVIDKKQGFIVTNHHVVGHAAIATYDIEYFNGTETTAQLLYYDSWQDFAFLKVDPKTIPAETPQIKLAATDPALGETVFIVGKNAGQNYSLQTGELSSHYDSMGHLPNQSYRISLNIRGGGSGSPIFTKNGEVVGIIHSSDYANFGFGLPIHYIKDAYEALKQGLTPKRRTPGMLVSYFSLDRAAKYYNFPTVLIPQYMKMHPNSFNRALMVESVFEDSPAHNKIMVGDIIWKINGKDIGPKLYEMEKAFNSNETESINITLFRQGKQVDVEVGLYDLQTSNIKRMVQFGGALFYEANDFIRYFTNAPKNALFLSRILEGSSFSDRLPPIPKMNVVMLNIVGFQGKQVQSLDDLIKIIPELVKARDFNMMYKNYGTYNTYDNVPMFSNRVSTTEISLQDIDSSPTLFEFDEKTLSWTITPLLKTQT